jgi:hypothetical protein
MDNAYALAFLLPLLMVGITVLDDSIQIFVHKVDVHENKPFARASLKRIVEYLILTLGIFGLYFLSNYILSLDNIGTNALNVPFEDDLILRVSAFAYIGLLALTCYSLFLARHLQKLVACSLTKEIKPRVQWKVVSQLNTRKGLGIMLLALIFASGVIVGAKAIPQNQMTFVYNQVGYYPQDAKVVYVQLNQQSSAADMNYVLSSTANGAQTLWSGKPQYAGTQFDEYYYSIDLSNLTVAGTYQVTVAIPGYQSSSISLTVSPNAYDTALLRATQFYYYQRSGSAINSFLPGYPSRPADCLDDGLVMADNGSWVYRNMSGGWHDAGDYGKYMEWFSNTQWATFCLAECYENSPAFFDTCTKYYGGALPDVLAEALWGADFLNKMVLPDGRVYTNIFGWNAAQNRYDRFTYTGQPQYITTNQPNFIDQRRIGSLYNTTGNPADITTADWRFIDPSAALMVGAALVDVAYLVNVTLGNSPSGASYDQQLINYVSNALAIYNREVPPILASPASVNYTALWTAALLNYELRRVESVPFGGNFNLTRIASDSTALFSQLLNQSTTIQDDNWDDEIGLYTLWLCGEQRGLEANVTQVLENYYYNALQPMTGAGTNVLQLTPFGDAASNAYLSSWGNNIGIATNCLLDALIYNATSITSAKTLALNQLNWILGQNPIGICQESDMGVDDLLMYHSQLVSEPGMTSGAPPGAIPNGVIEQPLNNNLANNGNGSAYLDLTPRILSNTNSANFYSNEIYITDNANYILALSTLSGILSN